MRIRLIRLALPFLWVAASLTVILIYIFYIYADESPRAFILRKYSRENVLGGKHDDFVREMNNRVDDIYRDLEIDKQPVFESKVDIKPPKPPEIKEIPAIVDNNAIDDYQPDDAVDDNPPLPHNHNQCTAFTETKADINTREEYQKFDFDASWMKNKGIWNAKFEERAQNPPADMPPLHVVILPHSHNDPGWLNTFEQYFQQYTRGILDSAVKKLPALSNMTFIWTEICFLDMWWQQASTEKRQTFRQLVHDGRIEIMSGGWVMTDEASAHIYAMVDQFIEGHQWVKHTLNVTPTHSWSIDPFGHGSTVPYLLGTLDFDGAIIQRIHYNWKEWLASRRYGDFVWQPQWNSAKNAEHSVLVHNMPFDMYFVDSSCGPEPKECGGFDFRWYPSLPDGDVPRRADQLIAQYRKSASLYPHNVFLAFVGGDFRYNFENEFQTQYNYQKIIDYVNANKEKYQNATLQFGTPKDYFRVVRERMQNRKFPTLVGDLLPYGDVFTSGSPAYWTGYYTTRPFVKIVCRELEHNLRNAEILFTIALNKAKQGNYDNFLTDLAKNYGNLVNARRNLGLFQHHDAITGTSRQAVMKNYLERMVESMKQTLLLQQQAIEFLVQRAETKEKNNFVEDASFIRAAPNDIPMRAKLEISSPAEIILFNSLSHERFELATVRVSSADVKIVDADGKEVPCQVNNVFTAEANIVADEFEVIFVARLPPLSLTKFSVMPVKSASSAYSLYDIKKLSEESGSKVQLDVSRFSVSVDKKKGSVDVWSEQESKTSFAVEFGVYNTAQKSSGAYLFKPDPKAPEGNVFAGDAPSKVILINGPLASYVKIFYGSLLTHTIRVLETKTYLDDGIFIENYVNMQQRHSNMEIFMRIKSAINNDDEFYTDLNGFQWQRRKRVSKIGVEGNYYPITVGAFIQDDERRMTLTTSHAQGATSPADGTLEVMIDRRTPVDDQRGMEEGVSDNLPNIQRHWLTFEAVELHQEHYQVPSIHAHNLMQIGNYPANIFLARNNLDIERSVRLLKKPLPCDLRLFNLRTLGRDEDQTRPSHSALLVAHRINYDCHTADLNPFYAEMCAPSVEQLDNFELFSDIEVKLAQSTSLTALKSHGPVASFRASPIEAMELKTFNVTFV